MKNTYLAKLASGAAITAMVLAGGSSMAFAQTTTTTGTGVGTTGTDTSVTGSTYSTTSTTGTTGTTPGVPNTGAGGDAATNLALLGISAVALIGGGAYLARQRFTQ